MSSFNLMMNAAILGVKSMQIHNNNRREEIINLQNESSKKRIDHSGCNVESIIELMFQEQCEHNYSKFAEAYVKYRQVVAEWMVDVCDYFNLHPTTTHAAISYLDRLQPNEKFTRFEWQMLAICCILISSKYNECEDHVPCIQKLEDITQQHISSESILNYELWALKKMGWRLNARTSIAFICSYCVVGITNSNDSFSISDTLLSCLELRKSFESQMITIATKCLLDIQFKPFQASILACAILFFVRRERKVQPVWRPSLTNLTMHDPFLCDGVVKVIHLLELKFNASVYQERSGIAELSYSGSSTSYNSSEMTSPVSLDKENIKPHDGSELSPIAIATFGNF
eukprot:gene7578-10326_t